MIKRETVDGWNDTSHRQKAGRTKAEAPLNNGDIGDWDTQEHASSIKRNEQTKVSLLDLADVDEPYNQERAEAQKKALEKTVEADLRSIEHTDWV